MDKKTELLTRWGHIKSERSSWWSHWKEISEYITPRQGRFFVQDRNKGDRRHNPIYDNTGTRALNVLAAGMMAGMTSPARPWFRLATSDRALMKYQPVKIWLNQLTDLMRQIFSRSNTYRSLHSMYIELGAFGTASNLALDDFQNVIHMYPMTIGEYGLAKNFKGEIDCVYREFEKTVAELVKEFGYKNCSRSVQNLFDRGSLDQWVTIVHAIEPRADRDSRLKDAKNMPFKSIYFEVGGDGDRLLRESGFKRFRALCPRWMATGEDIYGQGPGMEALGDVKQLQQEQLRKSQGIDYKTKPPLQVPFEMKDREADMLPGGINYVNSASPTGGIRTAFEVNLDLSHLLADIQDVRERIKSSFYADLFLMLANSTHTRMTATEVAERHEEKLLMLGPVLERLHNELLSPLIDITFDRIIEAGIMPPPPQEIQGIDINVEFVSMLAQAQRAIGTNSVDRFVGNLGMIAQIKPSVLDKFDEDKWADSYSDMLGVDPELIVAGDKVAMIRQERVRAQQQANQMAMLTQGADAMKSASQANTQDKNALTDVIRMFSGYSTPQGGG